MALKIQNITAIRYIVRVCIEILAILRSHCCIIQFKKLAVGT